MAKWLMESARTYVESNSPTDPSSAVLRSMVYNDFLHFVYDLDPKEWKAKYNGAPTQAQKDAYANSTNLHATHKEGIGSKTASVGSLVEDNSTELVVEPALQEELPHERLPARDLSPLVQLELLLPDRARTWLVPPPDGSAAAAELFLQIALADFLQLG